MIDAPGLRPTPDRVRETLFNWLGQDLSGWRCLDPFAGSGALGFEAASRGAQEVVMIERDPKALAALRAVQAKLDARAIRLLQGDALALLSSLRRGDHPGFDLVFLDPPFGQGWLERVLPLVRPLLAPGGLLYLESDGPLENDLLQGGEPLRAASAGQVHYHLLRQSNNSDPLSRSR